MKERVRAHARAREREREKRGKEQDCSFECATDEVYTHLLNQRQITLIQHVYPSSILTYTRVHIYSYVYVYV